jgi:hypothetical protein
MTRDELKKAVQAVIARGSLTGTAAAGDGGRMFVWSGFAPPTHEEQLLLEQHKAEVLSILEELDRFGC